MIFSVSGDLMWDSWENSSLLTLNISSSFAFCLLFIRLVDEHFKLLIKKSNDDAKFFLNPWKFSFDFHVKFTMSQFCIIFDVSSSSEIAVVNRMTSSPDIFLQFLLYSLFIFVCSSWAVKGELNNQQQTFSFIFLTRYSRVHSFVLREQQHKKVVKWEREWNEILIKVVLRVDFAFHWKYKDKFKVEIEYNMLLKLSVCSRSCSICTNPFDKTINHRSVGWSTSTAFCL